MIALLNSKLDATPAAAQTFMLTTISQLVFHSKDATHKGDSQIPLTKLSLRQGQVLDKSKPPTESKFQLAVPFYIYEELIWHNATVADKALDDYIAESKRIKHFDDYFFVKAALKHPMRVAEPAQAKLFVVPTLNNVVYAANYRGHKICVKGCCDGHDILRRAANFLAKSTWFQRHDGRDHVVVSSHYKSKGSTENVFRRCNAIIFEDERISDLDRVNIPHIYGSQPCSLEHTKTHDFAMVGNLKIGRRGFDTRSQICEWLPAHNYSTGACGEGAMCPVLAQSRFGFHVRGDTFGANRLFDTILSGTVPIFTFREQYGIIPQWINWESLSYFVEVTTEKAFVESLERILADKEGYTIRLENVLQHRHVLDWHSGMPFDIFMWDFQRQLFPETDKHNGTSKIFPIFDPL
jgi:hypothetical protein